MNNIKPHCARLIVIAVIVVLTATASMAQTHRTSIRVAAADSGPSDKEMADIVCDGRHDEIPLRRALESLGGCGRLEMASGDYIIDSFFTAEDGRGLRADDVAESGGGECRRVSAGQQEKDHLHRRLQHWKNEQGNRIMLIITV